jgi:hypothetical protein
MWKIPGLIYVSFAGVRAICSWYQGHMLAAGSQHRIAYLGQNAMDHRYTEYQVGVCMGPPWNQRRWQ